MVETIRIGQTAQSAIIDVLEKSGVKGKHNKRQWSGQKRPLSVEVEGDPFRRLTLVAPASADFGRTFSVMTSIICDPADARAMKPWCTAELQSWSKALRKGKISVLDRKRDFRHVSLRLQNLVNLIVITWEARP